MTTEKTDKKENEERKQDGSTSCFLSPLIGKTLEELQALVKSQGMPAFAAKQIADWIYKKKVNSIDEMTNISTVNRNKLKENYTVGRKSFVEKQKSKDGTVKYLFPVDNKHFIESVFIPDKERATLCVSTQIGCKMNCLFCMTGKQGFSGQLHACDILNQILSIPESTQLTNIVFMGMGEPLDNTDELFKVLDILTMDYGFGWSPKRITVSTAGLMPGLKRFLSERQEHLAISLHSPIHAERIKWMPVEKVYPVGEVLDLIRQYDFSHQRRLSFEYILFGGLNDDIKHASELVRMVKDIPCRINLIRYHKIPGIDLPATNTAAMPLFQNYLNEKGIICTIRASRGEDILAACGLLSTQIKQA
ncbi:MAG: 23S rRNA (adenine(2503)-C(2))-methyltransferase RlmN [Dysgonamonadaceae bacterium]|jgi:23S rRNA (adenine2503-C2)-methyltransferase|nr:23S rRNA (adenine(2503)-C(2))-methyltransferase RlmN [Dysgonamonadaceae bacterium]